MEGLQILDGQQIAYLTMEIALTNEMPRYAGGARVYLDMHLNDRGTLRDEGNARNLLSHYTIASEGRSFRSFQRNTMFCE